MKEYMELRNHNGRIEAVTPTKIEQFGEWNVSTNKLSVLNNYAKERWSVVGYTPGSILLERQAR